MIDNKLRIVAGNTFATAHTITAQDVQGQPIPDFDLQECTDIQVYARNGGSYKPVTSWQINDQSIIVLWYGKQMKLGGYDFYIAGKFGGADWRTSEATIFEIVQYNEEANIPADTIVVDGTYFTDASFSFITDIQIIPIPTTTLPLMDGVASVGTEDAYARGDHRHPSDTSKQDVIADLATIRSGAAAGASAYQKPSTGIPVRDMDRAVQRSLQKADMAVQPADIADMATETYVDGKVGFLQDAIDAIEAVIPSSATSSNQLADKAFVNSSISTNTATFIGTFNSVAELEQQTATNNDYAFVIETDAVGNEYYDRYKYNGSQWLYEYKVESTPFTAAQWAAIQSGITSALVTKIGTALQPSDIVDSLSSQRTDAALSANQGKVLNDRLSAIQGTFDYTLPDAPVIWKSGYKISSAGVVSADSAYRISDVIPLNDGETLNVAGVTNNSTKPLFTCSTSTATDESTFTLLSAADYDTTNHTASYKNTSGDVQYLVIVWRAANGQPTYTIAREGLDAPTLDEFNELTTNPSLNGYIDFTKELESSWTTYGYIIAATGLFSNSSNFNYVKFKRLSWMKKIRFMASGAVGSNASCIAFFSTDEVPTASDAKGFISAVQVLGLTDWVYEVDIPQTARMVIVSNRKALSTNHLIQIGTEFDKEDANAIYNLNPRDEFFTKIANANRPSDANVQPLTLLHFSDLHSDTENLERITQFANDYHEYIADILDTGDDVLDSYADDATFFNNVPYGGKILRTIGNHDSALHSGSTYTWDYYTAQQCYEKYFTGIATWGVTYTENLCYYYKDYADSGIRLIVTDCMHPTDAQYTWIENTLADAQTNSLDVVVAVHYPVRGTKIDCSFSDSNAIVVASAQTFITNLVQKVDAFISGGGTFVTYLCGHMHRDCIGFAGGATNRQLVIMVDCSKLYHTHDTDRTRGEKSQDSFNIVSIDKNLKLVKVIKVGANRGYTLREKCLCTLRYGSEAGLVYDECNGKYGTSVVNHDNTETSASIEPNVMHIWGEIDSLAITLSTPINSVSVVNEYMFQFVSGATPTVLNPINGVSWAGGSPTIEANKVYQASIVNGLGVIVGV